MENSLGLMKMQITHLIKFADSFAGIEVHVYVSTKIVKLNYTEEQFIDILRKLQQREVAEVWLKPEDCMKVLNKVQEGMSANTFYDPKTSDEQRVETSEAALKIVKQFINHLGPHPESLKLLKTINSRAMTLLSESPSLFAFIKRFKQNCSEEFLRTMLTSYLMSLILDKFSWRSDSLKEKGALASILCDMMLEKADFKTIREWEKSGGELPERLRNHPLEVLGNLSKKRNLIPSETLNIIELHHELPDGKGFPHGISATRFNPLVCVFILSQRFVEELFEENFDFNKRMDIIQRLQNKFCTKSFEKSLEALISIVDSGPAQLY